MRRIDPRPHRVGSDPSTGDPESLDDLQIRREKHERITRGKPERPFSKVLADRMRGGPEPAPEPPAPPPRGAIEPHLGLTPQQDRRLASGQTRSAKVIVKG